MRLIIMYKNEMMDRVEDVEQAHFYEDKVIMNKLPLNITELKLEKVSSINCQDINIEQLKQVKEQLALTEKALELACLSLRGKCDYCKYKDDEICPPDNHCSNIVMDYFIKQAEEMIKDAKN